MTVLWDSGPWFDWKISFGQIVNVVLILTGLVAFFIRDNERITTFTEWMRNHEQESKQRDRDIVDLGKIAAQLNVIAAATERRLTRLEGDVGGRRRM